jgi:phospholipid/cholesterol/gamma-HCH transport system substrate-binding protein
MENKAHALAAGAFVLFMTALLIGLGWWLSRDGAERVTYELTSRDTITGLQPQAAVRFRGVPVGKVADISFDPLIPGNVLIRISVDKTAPITAATYATLGYQGVTGQAHILLDDSGQSKEPLVSLNGAPARIPLRPSLMGRITDQGTQLLVQVEEIARRVNQLLATENQKIMLGSMTQAGEAAQSLHQLAQDMRTVLGTTGPQRPDTNVVDVLHSARGTLQSLQTTSEATRQAVTEVGQTVKRLQASGGTLDKLSQGAEALAQGAGTFNANTLPRLNQVSDEASRAVRQLGRTASTLSENPQSLLYGNGPIAPGPGEAGFAAPAAVPAH